MTPTAEPWLLNADIRGDTPLIVATRYGRSAKVARLLALGADVGATDQGGQTALHQALYVRGNRETVRLLLDTGADPTARGYQGLTPLDIVRSKQHPYSPLLQAAVSELQRPRLLLKARALLAARRVHSVLSEHFATKSLPAEIQQHILGLAAPLARMGDRREMPRVVEVIGGRRSQANATACMEYTLGVGEHEGKGMAEKAFVELMEMMVPKWEGVDF